MIQPHTHCHFCGAPYATLSWPRSCDACHGKTWLNPIPIVVALVPCGNGILAGRRAIEPAKGLFALPGGYIELGETWEKAAARELSEEMGIVLPPESFRLFKVCNASNGNVLIFGYSRIGIREREIQSFVPNHEVSAVLVAQEGDVLAFPSHTEALVAFLRSSEYRAICT